uniref:Glycine N-acyltransferase-like protein n=1 Tax=Chelydra serpentina TaxID=8475 RepID=A0A8C3XVV8_CHESE
MLLLSCSSKLRLLEGTLRRHLPEMLPVHGVMMNINCGKPAGQEVLVDTWPEFKAILTRPHREVRWHGTTDFYTNMYTAFYRDLDAYWALLGSAVNWGQAFHIHSNMGPTALGRLPQQLSIYVLSGPNPWIPPYIPSPDALSSPLRLRSCSHELSEGKVPMGQLDPAVRLSTLDVSHAVLVNETWAFGGNENSRRYLANLIRRFPNVCLLDAAERPVSWTITDPFGTTKHSYTLPQHQRCGYMQVLMNVMAKQMQAWGYPSFCHVATDNYPMQRLQERQGFPRQPNLCHFILHNAALHRIPTLTPSPAPGTAP